MNMIVSSVISMIITNITSINYVRHLVARLRREHRSDQRAEAEPRLAGASEAA